MSIFVLSFRNSISFFASLMDRSPWSSRLFRSILPLELHFFFSLSFIFLSDFLVSFFSCSSYLCLSYFWVLDESLPVGFVFHLSFPLSAFLPINCLLSSENFLVSSRDVSFSYKCLPLLFLVNVILPFFFLVGILLTSNFWSSAYIELFVYSYAGKVFSDSWTLCFFSIFVQNLESFLVLNWTKYSAIFQIVVSFKIFVRYSDVFLCFFVNLLISVFLSFLNAFLTFLCFHIFHFGRTCIRIQIKLRAMSLCMIVKKQGTLEAVGNSATWFSAENTLQAYLGT